MATIPAHLVARLDRMDREAQRDLEHQLLPEARERLRDLEDQHFRGCLPTRPGPLDRLVPDYLSARSCQVLRSSRAR